MEPQLHVSLASLTSLSAGGAAERLYTCTTNEQLQTLLQNTGNEPLWVLGYGANALISDKGLPGTTILVRTSNISQEGELVIADSGVWWDDLVQFAIGKNLWGLELMSAIPGGVGAAVVGNIAAYGQAVADSLVWVDVFDSANQQIRRLLTAELGLSYRYSSFQTEAFKNLVILRAAYQLSPERVKDVVYQSALDIANELGANLDTLEGRRQTILETRKRAGSLWDYRTADAHMHTAGSFFRNPMVDASKAEEIMAYDETGKSIELLKKMNLVHGGEQKRVSGAHVLLAAGFARGQTWGKVRLHPDHILKIENTGGASAQEIYDVAQNIIRTVKDKLGIDIVPEVRFLGKFDT